MSGGVDSSLAAALLVGKGHEVVGLTMRLFCHEEAGHERSCCSMDSIESARQTAAKLGIPHHVVDLRRDFRDRVIDNFIGEYRAGRTPNPCVECNRHVKFGALLERARALGCGRLATGHYVRIVTRNGVRMLAQGVDERKDQSYFLWALGRRQLERAVFPLGGMAKAEVRRRARELGLAAAERPESQEICFSEGSYADYLERRFPAEPGDIVDREGRVLGRHRGIARYTVGQREGLGLALGRPLYVLEIDPAANRITVGEDRELLAGACLVEGVNWVPERPRGEVRCLVRIRHRHPGAAARIKLLSKNRAEVRFDGPQRAVTPGQSAVFYRGGVVLGGGVIGAQQKNRPAS
jgi:tRNA-specific 2-thiouridylase